MKGSIIMKTTIIVSNPSEVPLDYFKTKVHIIDCSNYNIDEEIGLEVLENICIYENTFIIFKTNIQENYPYGREIYIKNHHELSWDVINYLIEKKVAFIGIDCAGIRRGNEHFKVDIKCEENKTYIIENLDLSKLTEFNKEYITAYTMWIDNPFSTGLSTRVILDI